MKSVDTIADLQKFKATVDTYVFVGGYYAIGDGGGGLFVWESTASDSVDNGIIFHSTVASGQWKRLFNANEVWVDWWGARGDGNTDDAPAIQTAINYLLSPIPGDYNRGGTLKFSDRKIYSCGSPLVIFGLNVQSVGITLSGQTPSYFVGVAPVLSFAYPDKPGIIVQTGRAVYIKNLTIKGVNDFSAKLSSDDAWAIDANYVSSSVAVRTNRYSPYAAISIDSFENSITADNRYPALNHLYAYSPGGGSKQIHIAHCSITNWYVGIMIDSSAANAQGDSCFIHHNIIQTCTYGVAIGQTQSRGVEVRDNEFAACKVVCDWATFGQQNGTPPHIQGGLVDGAKYLLLGPATGIGNLQVDGVYSELLCSLGIVATAAHPNNWPTVFSACHFSFHRTTRQTEAHLICGGAVKFVGCALSSIGTGCFYFQTLKNNSSDSPSIEFDNTTLRTENPCGESQIYVNAFTHARWTNASTFDPYWSNHIDTGEGHPLTDQRKVNALRQVNRKVVTPGETIMTPSGRYVTDFAEGVVGIGTHHGIVFDGNGGATLTLPSPGLFKIGDIVRGAESNGVFNIIVQGITVFNVNLPKVGVISNIVGNIATLIEVPSCFDSGSVQFKELEVAYMKRFHQPTTGNVINGSTSITNCAISGGIALTSAWFVGNRIHGLGILNGAYVTHVSATNLTISAPAVGTNRGTGLYDAIVSSVL